MKAEKLAASVGLCLFLGCSGKPVEEIRPTAAVTETAAGSVISPAETDWPWWRGTTGDGSANGSAPTKWSAHENVVWSIDVPGKGHASPTIWGDQVFLATADDKAETMSLLSFDRKTGKPLWNRELHQDGFMHIHAKNSQASATPACDGQRVYWTAMIQGGIWVSAVDLAGKIAWQTEAGPFKSMHGYGSSPVLYKNLVIVAGDSNGPGFLAALNRETGKIAWRVQRGSTASFGTPVIAETGGKTQLLLSGQALITSYDPETGDQLWQAEGPASVTANTMVWNEDLVFASGGFPEQAVMAIRADGSGEIVWKQKQKAYVPSLLLAGERLIVVQDAGIIRCLAAATGKEQWNKRLGGDITASPVLAGGNVYVTTEAGKTFVFPAEATYQSVAENDLGEPIYATPAIGGGRIYLRTLSRLYCVGDPRGG